MSNRRRFALVVGIVIGIALMTFPVYLYFSDSIHGKIRDAIEQYLRSRVKAIALAESDGALNIELGAISYTYYTGLLEVKDIKVKLLTGSDSVGSTIEVAIPRVTVSGVLPWDILTGAGLSIGSINVFQPSCAIRSWGITAPSTMDTAQQSDVQLPKLPNVDSILHIAFVGLVPSYAQPLNISGVKIIGGSFTNSHRSPAESYEGNMNGIAIDVGKITVDAAKSKVRPIASMTVFLQQWKRQYSNKRSIFVDGLHIAVSDADSSLTVDSVQYHLPAAYTYSASAVVFSYRTRVLRLSGFTLEPSMDDEQYWQLQKYDSDRFRIHGTQLHFEDIDFSALNAGKALRVKKISLASLELDILSNKRLRADPKSGLPTMPNHIVRSLPFVLDVDSIVISNASLRYGERWAHSAAPALLTWKGISAIATDLRSGANKIKRPFTVSASGTFMGGPTMKATFSFPLTDPVYKMAAEGSLTRFDITALNSFLPIADNARIESGIASSASFSFTITGRRCRGVVRPHYSNLSLLLVGDTDKKSGGFLKGIVSALVNWLVIKNDNEGEDYRDGPIRYTLPRDAAFMQTIWFPVRSGLKVASGL